VEDLCQIAKELVGLASGDARAGETVQLIYGGSLLHLLRETSENDVYSLIGDEYVHDHMNGRPCHEDLS
jgi:hypothetical protein